MVKNKAKSEEVKSVKKQENESEVLLKAQLARALADYDNLQKRVERERGEIQKLIGLSIIERLLPVLDNLEEVQKHIKDQGLAIAINNFKELLKSEDLEEIVPVAGQEFAHETQEAVVTVDGGQVNTISEVLQNGWKFKDGPVIRAAKVKVYK